MSCEISIHKAFKPVRLVTIGQNQGQNLEWPRGRMNLARKNPHRNYDSRFSSSN